MESSIPDLISLKQLKTTSLLKSRVISVHLSTGILIYKNCYILKFPWHLDGSLDGPKMSMCWVTREPKMLLSEPECRCVSELT